MKQQTTIVIAALMITSIAFAISTSNVSANPEVSISPETVSGDKYVLLTISVTNDTGDNISRILLRGSGWTEPMGGAENVLGQWENVADNLSKAADELTHVIENLREAVVPLKAAGTALKAAADGLEDAGYYLVASLRENATAAGVLLRAADDYLRAAGAELENEPENFEAIVDALTTAQEKIEFAGDNLAQEPSGNLSEAGANLLSAAGNLTDAIASLNGGDISSSSMNIGLFAENVKMAGDNLAEYLGDGQAEIRGAGDMLDNVVSKKSKQVADNLGLAAENIYQAGEALKTIKELYLDNAENLIKRSTGLPDNLPYLGENFLVCIGNVANALGIGENNLFGAGENLKAAGENLGNIQTSALLEFGSSYLGTLPTSADNLIVKAGENMSEGSVNLTVAADLLEDVATKFKEAAAKLKDTKGKIKPAHWMVTTSGIDARLDAENRDYYIAPGASQDFVFLWYSPTGGEYKIEMWTYDGDFVVTSYERLEITVEDIEPSLTIKVTQTGVEVDNVVGTVYQDGKATITIEASETLSDMGTIHIESEGENLLPPITMADLETTDHKVFTYEFEVGEWDDNVPEVSIEYVTDLYGNENATITSCRFYTDTRAPIFIENGLSGLLDNFEEKVQAGTGKVFLVDNNAKPIVEGHAEDNYLTPRFGYENDKVDVVKVYVNDVLATPTPDNGFTTTITMSEGLNPIVIVRAVDWVGNEVSENIENIFIDSEPPTIEFNTVAGKAWDENGELINDSTPTIVLSITDAGLGVAYPENLRVVLDNNDNIDAFPEWGGNLDNASPYVWSVTAGATFENIVAYENGEPLSDGTYWIGVVASDNIAHNGEENVVLYRSFTIDATAPTVPLPTTALENPLIATTVASPYVQKSATLILSGTGLTKEVGAILSVYLNNATTAATTATVDSAGRWTVEISLTAGTTTKVEVALTDVAGNEGARRLYGYAMADGNAPTVTLTTPPETTDKASIVISGTVSKDSWEDWSDITLTAQLGTGQVTVPITEVSVNEGSYNYSLSLAEGSNTIVVQAIDEAGNPSDVAHATVERTVTSWGIYAIILVVIALVLAAVAIFAGPKIWKR